MAAGDQNIHDVVKQAVNRDATDYELSTFGKASPQVIANLPSYYSGLNRDVSIVDYLKYNGQDPSESNRNALAQKYGITNAGTAEGNTALIKALKGGEPAPAPVTGSITTPPVAADAATPSSGTDAAGTTPPAPAQVPGTVSNAATPPDNPARRAASAVCRRADRWRRLCSQFEIRSRFLRPASR